MRRHLSSANVLSTLALFLVVAGGTALAAALPKDSVRSKQVKDNALKSADLKDGKAVAGTDVVDDDLGAADVADSGLTGANFVDQNLEASNLQGADIAEAALGQVPLARQGGLGRHGVEGTCDPETTAFLTCSSVTISLAQPGRLLLIGFAYGTPENPETNGRGACRLATEIEPILASEMPMIAWEEDITGGQFLNFHPEAATLAAVTNVLPPGLHTAEIECNQGAGGAFRYSDARVVAVGLSAG